MDNYTISGTNIMTTTSQINETTLTLPYNARQTIEVAATNCIGTSGPATFTYFEGRSIIIASRHASSDGISFGECIIFTAYLNHL